MTSFRKRLLVLIIGLVVVTQTVTLAAVLASTAHNVEARAAEQLRSGSSFVQQLIRFRGSQLANGVAVLAADFGFREAVASGDVPTILSAARNNAQRIGADIVFLLNTQGALVASTAPEVIDNHTPLASLIRDTHGHHDQPSFMVFGERPYQLFLAPVRTPETIAWVAMGFGVDDSLAQRIHDLAGAQVVLVSHGPDGTVHVASTLPSAKQNVSSAPSAEEADAPHVVKLAGTDYLGFSERLESHGDPLDVTLLKPMSEVLTPYQDVRDALLAIDGIALVLAAVVGTLLGRSAARPIGDLVLAARRIQQGQYETAVEVSGGDEFRSLADTFNAMQRNIAERERDITHHLYHDSLTSLPNRAKAENQLERLVAGAKDSASFTLILIDLRNVHDINASLGHHVGDDVLREAARRLRQNAHNADTVARLGETQFLIIAHDCRGERAPLYAEQLTGVVRTGFHLSGISLDLHVACGVCVYPDHGDSAATLLRRAQIALEDSTTEGRTRVAVYRTGSDEEHRRRLTLITDLRTAIDRDGLSLVYQPKVTMATRSVKSLEALVRWTHPQLGPISPAEFVPLAEATGGARRLTSWVLKAAIGQMGQWREAGLDVDVAVNLSAPDILDPDLGDEILYLLRSRRVEPTSLLLEITESAVMRDPHLAARNMQLLRVAGVRFAIDDFGTGHSSLSQLNMLPVDELKIDRSFISHARLGSDAATIVTSTIELGHRMSLDVVAEGVEEPEAWNLLRQLGCDFAQGYLISRPLAPKDVPAFVVQANQLLPASDSTVLQIRALDQLTARFRG
jgi:diguanylate cyclase (GGDEF)-like protein